MNLSRIIYRIGTISQNFELTVILAWLLLFPFKENPIYYLGFSLLILLFSLRKVYLEKNFPHSRLTYVLLSFNLLLLAGTVFSLYRFNSLFLLADLMLVSFYFILSHFRWFDRDIYFRSLLTVISLLSFIEFLNDLLPLAGRQSVFFDNPILQGVLSAIGCLVALWFLLKKWRWFYGVLLFINLAAVLLSASKGAALGLFLVSFYLVAQKKKILLLLVVFCLLLVLLIPNPVRQMVSFSLHEDPYALNRLEIWKMSLRMTADHWLTGVGLDNFPEAAKRYNFKQPAGPANYFKVARQSHSDYLKLISEAGIPGLLILLGLGWFVVKTVLTRPRFLLEKALILFLLFEALFFNLLFRHAFFFIFLFLVTLLFQDFSRFVSFSALLKGISLMLLFVTVSLGVWLPFASHALVKRAGLTGSAPDSLKLLIRAETISPLDIASPYLQAGIYSRHFVANGDWDSFAAAWAKLRQVQRLNPTFVPAFTAEADLKMSLINRGLKYRGLLGEIQQTLQRAEAIDPYNPFLKLKMAAINREFDRMAAARDLALKAVGLEADFTSAHHFLQRYFNHYGSEENLQRVINAIKRKYRGRKLTPGTYLYDLVQEPSI